MITEKQAFKIAYKIGVITAYELLEYRENTRNQHCRVYSLEQFAARRLSLVQGDKRMEGATMDSNKKPGTRTSRACHGHGVRLVKANGKGD